MRAPLWLRLTLAAIIALFAITLARAQDGAGATEPAPLEPPPPVVDEAPTATPEQLTLLETVHLTELAQQTRIALRDARPLMRADTSVLRIERALTAQETQVAHLTSPARLAQIPMMSQRELADHRQAWRAMREHFEEEQETLAARSAELEVARTPLVELRRTWRALRDAVVADRGPDDARLPRIESSIELVRVAATTLETERDAVQALEDRVGELVIASEDVGDDIRDALAAYRDRLFVRDRAPLWDGLGADVVDANELPWGEHLAAQGELVREQSPAIFRLGLAIALLALVLGAARRRLERVAAPAELESAMGVARKPIATALVLGLLASGFVVTNAPVFFFDSVAVVIVAPIAWLLWPLVPRSMRAFIAIVAATVVIDRIEGTMSDGSALRRGLVLAESIGFGGALGAWVQRESVATDDTTRQARGLAVIAGSVLGAAFVANVLGYAFLATVLVRGTAFALGGALSLATALRIFDALSELMLSSPLAQRSHGVRLHRALIHARLHRGLVLALCLAWGVLVLGGYGLATPFFSWLDDTLRAHGSFGTLDLSLGEVLGAALVLCVSWIITRMVLFVLELDVLPRLSLEAGVGGAISGLTRYMLFGLGLILALATLGIDASQIALVAGALGVGVGFGLQGIVANFIAGLVLMLERPVRLGDRIEVGSLVGSVDRIGLRSSTVRGDDGAEVIVPNETLIGREVVNWTLSDRKRRVQIAVGVAYGTDPRRVVETVLAAVMGHERVLGRAEGATDPVVQFTAFGPSSLDFVVRFWTADEDDGTALKSEIGILVLDALIAAKIEIPFPQQEVRVLSLPKS
jgi:potassium efflux system protein